MSLMILSGPTASGKSHLADLIYDVYPSKIINADSMQIYDALPILSAQPEDLNKDIGKYALYGSMPYTDSCSVAKWFDMAVVEIDAAMKEGKMPVIVGGTGLYLKALLEGIVEIPDVNQDVRLKVREEFEKLGKSDFYKSLIAKDPKISDKIHSNDTSRMVRAMEVYEQTGVSIYDFKDKKKKPLNEDYIHISLFPDRAVLYSNCDERFDEMLEQGAIEEVKNFYTDKKSKYAVENTLGYHEIKSYLEGSTDLDKAKEKTKQATRNYAKRQMTWFRNQMPNKQCLHYKSISEIEDDVLMSVMAFKGPA